jgi:hypothetical protein
MSRKQGAAPTAEELAKAISDIALFPDAVAVFYDAQKAGLCGMVDPILVTRVISASALFRIRNDAEHVRIVSSVRVEDEDAPSPRAAVRNRKRGSR